jgi:hypothetical protein
MAAITASVIAAAGVATAGVGAAVAYDGSQDAAEASSNIYGEEMEMDEMRKKQMKLEAQRSRLETIRRAQITRSMSLTTATNQGAQQSSGLAGAYGQTSGQMFTNLLGINQNESIGMRMFGINADMALQKMLLAQAQSQTALGSGLMSLGGSMASSAGTLGNIFGNYGGATSPTTLPTYTPWYSQSSPTMQGPLPSNERR